MTATEMHRDEYLRMDAVEERMFFYRALHERLEFCLDRFVAADADVLDVGCGTGGFLRRLQSSRPSSRLAGVDVSPLACELASRKTGLQMRQASVEHLPFGDEEFDAIVAADVLNMLDEPGRALRELRRCLRARGIVVVNFPAYEWLRSYHDVAVGTKQRYTRRRLRALFEGNGFIVELDTYWNTLLFPLAVARRKLAPGGNGSDVRLTHPLLERAFRGVLDVEARLIRRGMRLPFGLSVLGVARRA